MRSRGVYVWKVGREVEMSSREGICVCCGCEEQHTYPCAGATLPTPRQHLSRTGPVDTATAESKAPGLRTTHSRHDRYWKCSFWC